MTTEKVFETTLAATKAGRVYAPTPFDPDAVWSRKPRHPVSGTIGACRFRAVIEPIDGVMGMALGPVWLRDNGFAAGQTVQVAATPEGPQRGDLAPDIAAALEASPAAGAFFDGLAQFYRKGYLRWIEGTKRRPEVRAARIAEFVGLLEAGKKERPGG